MNEGPEGGRSFSFERQRIILTENVITRAVK